MENVPVYICQNAGDSGDRRFDHSKFFSGSYACRHYGINVRNAKWQYAGYAGRGLWNGQFPVQPGDCSYNTIIADYTADRNLSDLMGSD